MSETTRPGEADAYVTTALAHHEVPELEIGGQMVQIGAIGKALAGLEFPVFVAAIREIIAGSGGDQLKLLIDGLEIQSTPSAFTFANIRQVTILEQVAKEYPLTRWLENMGVLPSAATRDHLIKWWSALMLMAGEHGYVPGGQIDQISRTTNLWKATGPLAAKMQMDPAAYRFLPALLINHSQEVSRVLGEIGDPAAFLEVLTGERLEDMRESPTFLGAFSLVTGNDGLVSRTVTDALFSVQMVLQRD